jgi:hypothetical protein
MFRSISNFFFFFGLIEDDACSENIRMNMHTYIHTYIHIRIIPGVYIAVVHGSKGMVVPARARSCPPASAMPVDTHQT